MRKLKLDLAALHVESFEPRAGDLDRAGTVRAHGSVDGCDPPPDTNFNQHTCDVLSCGGTCLLTAPCCPNNSNWDPCG